METIAFENAEGHEYPDLYWGKVNPCLYFI